MIKYLESDLAFDNEVKEGLVLVDFYADWCGPCRMFSEIIDEVVKEKENLKILKINIDKFDDISKKYGVMSIPTILLFKEGQKVKENVGFLSLEELEDFIK